MTRECRCPRGEHYAAAMAGEPPECVAAEIAERNRQVRGQLRFF